MKDFYRKKRRILPGFLAFMLMVSGLLLSQNEFILLAAAQEEAVSDETGSVQEQSLQASEEQALPEQTLPESADHEGVQLLQKLTGREINPIYRDFIASTHRIAGNKLLFASGAEGDKQPPDIPYYTSLEDAGAAVRKEMVTRTATIEVGFLSASDAWEDLVEEVVALACTHTGVPTEGDYLKFHYYQYGIDGMMYDSGDEELPYQYAFTLSFDYLSSYEQELEVSAALAVIMSGLNLKKKTEYGKAAAVYDYVCSHVAYDYEHLSDTAYLRKHSCYAAVLDKKAVCQGFALMLYRMLETAGIDN